MVVANARLAEYYIFFYWKKRYSTNQKIGQILTVNNFKRTGRFWEKKLVDAPDEFKLPWNTFSDISYFSFEQKVGVRQDLYFVDAEITN